jgi:hypothetical protein
MLMPPGSTSFGGTVQFLINGSRLWEYNDVILAPSIDPSTTLPCIVQVWTDDYNYKNPDTNVTTRVNPVLWYRVVELKPNISVVAVSLSHMDDTTVVLKVTVTNTGVIGSSADDFNITIQEGDYYGYSGPIAVQYPVFPLFLSHSFTFFLFSTFPYRNLFDCVKVSTASTLIISLVHVLSDVGA